MRKIISSIDIGNNSIKLVVGEFIENELHILCASKTETFGLENNKITNKEELIFSIKKVTNEASTTLGIPIKKIVLCLNSVEARLVKSAAAIKINSDTNTICGEDISKVIQTSVKDKIPENNVLVNVIPVEFTVDGDQVVKDPKGIISKNLGIKALISSCSKRYASELISIIEEAGLKTVDVILSSIGDYFSFQKKSFSNEVGAIINIGYSASTVSIFNKGIITNTKMYNLGGKNLIKDIAFVNKIDETCAKAVYKDLGIANGRLANPKNYRIVNDIDGNEVKINQTDVSEIIAKRIEEILNLAKKQINILTKREISYIIVTGGLTELKDFSLTLDDSFGKNVYLGKINLIGARDNSFSSSIGALKYFNQKLELKGKNFSIFTDDDLKELNSGGTRSNDSNSSLLSKVFGYFFDS